MSEIKKKGLFPCSPAYALPTPPHPPQPLLLPGKGVQVIKTIKKQTFKKQKTTSSHVIITERSWHSCLWMWPALRRFPDRKTERKISSDVFRGSADLQCQVRHTSNPHQEFNRPHYIQPLFNHTPGCTGPEPLSLRADGDWRASKHNCTNTER